MIRIHRTSGDCIILNFMPEYLICSVIYTLLYKIKQIIQIIEVFALVFVSNNTAGKF